MTVNIIVFIKLLEQNKLLIKNIIEHKDIFKFKTAIKGIIDEE